MPRYRRAAVKDEDWAAGVREHFKGQAVVGKDLDGNLTTDDTDGDPHMKILTSVAIVFLLGTTALAQVHSENKTKEEIQNLFTDLNDAMTLVSKSHLTRR